jgi:hypothetical protein
MTIGSSLLRQAVPMAGTLGLIALLSATPLIAQGQSPLQRDIEFVRKLASELGFVSLALEEVETLKREHQQSDDFKLIAQLGIEISLRGAKLQPDREDQRRLYKEAIEKSTEFISRYDGEPVVDQARENLADACAEYGRFLIQEIELAREEEPEKVAELEETAAEVFKRGIDACSAIMASLEDEANESEEKWLRYHLSWMNKGILQREQGRAVKADRDALANLSRGTLEELVFDVGEETVLGQKAFFEYAQNDEVVGDLKGAASSYRDVADSMVTVLEQAQSGEIVLPPAAQELLFRMMQEVYDRLTRVTLRLGDTERVLQLCADFQERLKAFGEAGADPFEIAHPQFGHPVFLTYARALAESGNRESVDKALELAQRISDEHENDFVGIQAKGVLKEILAIRADAVSGRILFDIANGELSNANYEAALKTYKRALSLMTDEEKAEYGLEAHWQMTRTFGVQKRYFESVLAAVEGLDEYGSTASKELTTRASSALQTAWDNLRRSVKDEMDNPLLAELDQRVTDTLARFAGDDSVAKQAYRNAATQFRDGKYADAAASFAEVPTGTIYYEPSQGLRVASLVAADDFAGARQTIADYKKWLETEDAKLDPRRSDQQRQRDKTIGQMEFYSGFMDYADVTKEGSSQPERYPALIDHFEKFLDEQADVVPDLAPRAYDMVARLYVELGQIDKAEAKYNELRQKHRGDRNIPRLATTIFTAHTDNVKALELEFEALSKDSGADRRSLRDLETRLTAARRAALSSAQDYAKTSDDPQFGVLYNAVRYALDLQDWNTCIQLGNQTLERYGDGDDSERSLNYVRRWLGRAYMRKPDPNWDKALELFRAVEKRDPGDYEVKRLISLALGGWVQPDQAGNLNIVEGAGKPGEAYDKYYVEYKPAGLLRYQRYDYEWYKFHWEAYFFARRASELLGNADRDWSRFAETLYSLAEAGDDFAKLRSYGKQGEELAAFFSAYPPR